MTTPDTRPDSSPAYEAGRAAILVERVRTSSNWTREMNRILAEERAEERRRTVEAIRERLASAPTGWTRPDDQFGPQQYSWFYTADVTRILDEIGGAS